jgi:hypothetical protein
MTSTKKSNFTDDFYKKSNFTDDFYKKVILLMTSTKK